MKAGSKAIIVVACGGQYRDRMLHHHFQWLLLFIWCVSRIELELDSICVGCRRLFFVLL